MPEPNRVASLFSGDLDVNQIIPAPFQVFSKRQIKSFRLHWSWGFIIAWILL